MLDLGQDSEWEIRGQTWFRYEVIRKRSEDGGTYRPEGGDCLMLS